MRDAAFKRLRKDIRLMEYSSREIKEMLEKTIITLIYDYMNADFDIVDHWKIA